MTSPSSARMALRTATRDHHDRVDALFSGPATRDRAAYARFLRAQAGAHLAVEAALDRDGAAAVLPDWPQRRRAHLLRDDLQRLGEAVPPPAGTIGFDGAAALLGGIYVLEGSRMGGALLRREVAADWPASFLAPAAPDASWRTLTAMLDARLAAPEEVAAASHAAVTVFALFEESGRQHLGEGQP